MPPQYNRRSSGPRTELPGPVDRFFQQQNFRVQPKATEGPDLSNAEMFNSLQRSLNVGVQAIGQYRSAIKQEKAQALGAQLEETKLAFSRGTATMADYDVLLSMYGTDDASRTQILRGMSQAEYYSRMGVAGNYVGSQIFNFDTLEKRTAVIESLPGKDPLDEELADYFENTARESVPTFDGLSDNDRTQMLRFGMRQFKDELDVEEREMRIEAARVQQESWNREENAILATMADGDVGPELTNELVDIAVKRAGGDTDAAISDIASKLAMLDLETFDNVIRNIHPDFAQVDNTQKAIDSARASIIKRDVGKDRAVAAATSISRDGVGADFVNENPDVPADALPEVMVMLEMDRLGLDYDNLNERAVVADEMENDVKAAMETKKARESFIEIVQKIEAGRPVTETELSQVYEAGFSGIRNKIANINNMSMSEVYQQFGDIGYMANAWSEFDGSTKGRNPQIPKELAADVSNLLNGDAKSRLMGVALFKGLGGATNPKLTGVLNSKQIAMAVGAGHMLGKYASPSAGNSSFLAPGMSVADEAVMTKILMMNETESGNAYGPLWKAQKTALSTELATQYNLADGNDVFSTLPSEAQDVVSMMIANMDVENGAAFAQGVITSMGFKLVKRTDGGPSFYTHDPNNYLFDSSQGTLGEFTDRVIAQTGVDFFSERLFGKIEGFDRLFNVGEVVIDLDTTSLSPMSPYAVFDVSHIKGGAAYPVLVPWDQIGNMKPTAPGEPALRQENEGLYNIGNVTNPSVPDIGFRNNTGNPQPLN